MPTIDIRSKARLAGGRTNVAAKHMEEDLSSRAFFCQYFEKLCDRMSYSARGSN